ncbi:MAG TPA: glutamine amidotransferase [Syntrophomonadaceae bacterium]|nr:glutamine amidotransferase [Syntrophomonadaceae bacterium]HQE22580.1 glutamine amidotransferase [Syntrophomonadaceae bacterium]
MASFCIAHLYPDLMNLYGDRGNLICLQKRLEWYGHNCSVQSISLNSDIDYRTFDMIFMGGGSDREQGLVYQDLLRKADQLWKALDAGLPALLICGAYQLLGTHYESFDGKKLKGLGFFNLYTQGETERLIGNIVLACRLNNTVTTVVGFENHAGRTYLEDKSLESFGTVLAGFGNNGQDGHEGVRYKNLIGTYLHGPLLPKNPAVADFFINIMAARKGVNITTSLNDRLEDFAHQQIKRRVLGS